MLHRKPRLEILFGPIASGKSTYARKRGQEGALVVNDDAIVTAVHGGNYSGYRKDLKGLYKGLRSQIIHAAALTRRDVVVDSTGLYRSTRDHLRTMGRSLGMDVALVICRDGQFKGAVDGRRRFEADPRGLTLDEWQRIGQRHAANHDRLGVDEDPDPRYEQVNGRLYDATIIVCWKGEK